MGTVPVSFQGASMAIEDHVKANIIITTDGKVDEVIPLPSKGKGEIPRCVAEVLALALERSAGEPINAPVGRTGYLDGFDVADMPGPVAHGQDKYGRYFVAFRVEFTWPHCAPKPGVFTVAQRYSDNLAVWVTAGPDAVPLCYSDKLARCEQLSRLLLEGETTWGPEGKSHMRLIP